MNITGRDPSAFAADLGMASEFIVTGILIRLGFDVGVMQVTRVPYDLWLRAFEVPGGNEVSLRVQVKTLSKSGSIKLIGGTRAGVDRVYKSGVKTYKYTIEHSDLMIGFDRYTFDLYLIPTRFAAKWGKSKSVKKLQPLRNNWNVLLNWNDTFLSNLENQLE